MRRGGEEYLDVGEGIHLLHGPGGGHGQRDVQALVGVEHWEGEGGGGGEAEAVLVELDAEALHGLHRLVAEGHLHVHHVVLEAPGARELEALTLLGRQPDLARGSDLDPISSRFFKTSFTCLGAT